MITGKPGYLGQLQDLCGRCHNPFRQHLDTYQPFQYFQFIVRHRNRFQIQFPVHFHHPEVDMGIYYAVQGLQRRDVHTWDTTAPKGNPDNRQDIRFQ